MNSQTESHRLYFWRTHSKLEVDFIVYGPKGFWTFEVKRSSNISSNDVKSLNTFQKEYPEAKCVLLYGGDKKQTIRDIECRSVEEFLSSLDPRETLM